MKTTRRNFIGAAGVTVAGLSTGMVKVTGAESGGAVVNGAVDKLAVLGGKPVHTGGWQSWPMWKPEWEASMLDVMRSRRWFRMSGPHVFDFERKYAQLIGAKRCLATASGTTALITSLHVLDVQAGDEVIVSPYTFIASYNAILSHHALPVLADTDPATFTIDPKSIASRITDRTRAIMPVHIYGMPCDMDPIAALAKERGLKVVEDACQAWLAEYKGRKCGTLGDVGCFSFQESKHLPSGEGGAITSDSEDLIDRANAYHNCGRPSGGFKGTGSFTRGMNYRMTQFQGALLIQQIDKLVMETARRRENADYLNQKLAQIPGITPMKLPENSRAVWHLYALRYDSRQFQGVSRNAFTAALAAEGIPAHAGYTEQYFEGILDEAIASRGYKRLFSAERLKAYRDSFHELKGNKETVATCVGLPQTVLLADKPALDHIVDAFAKVHANAGALAARRSA